MCRIFDAGFPKEMKFKKMKLYNTSMNCKYKCYSSFVCLTKIKDRWCRDQILKFFFDISGLCLASFY